MNAEVLKPRVARGRNLTLLPCYPDTCVWIDAFLEDFAKAQDSKTRQKVANARELFRRHDGPDLVTSPFVLAELLAVMTDPKKPFQMAPEAAKKRLWQILETEKVQVSLPAVDLYARPILDLPVFDYSMRLNGTSEVQGTQARVAAIFRRGRLGRVANYGGGAQIDIQDFYEKATWQTAVLGSSLSDLLVQAALDSTSSRGGRLGLQDAITVLFARGLGACDFVTSDERLIQATGRQPYPDVRAWPVSDYLVGPLNTASGQFRN